MQPDRAMEIINRQRGVIKSLLNTSRSDTEFSKWRRDTEVAIEKIFGQNSRHITDFTGISYNLSVFTSSTSDYEFVEAYKKGLQKADAILRSFSDEIAEYEMDDEVLSGEPEHLNLIERICLKFHGVCRQLQSRHADRSTLTIDDEYDVQDLLHALLRVHFDDIRPEEWTPSYAGGSARVDFLLKAEQIVIEVKKTRASMRAADLGAQLLVDIARYQHHPDCKLLVCFVYDPEGRVGNPVGIERDLEAHGGPLKVRVIIGPKA